MLIFTVVAELSPSFLTRLQSQPAPANWPNPTRSFWQCPSPSDSHLQHSAQLSLVPAGTYYSIYKPVNDDKYFLPKSNKRILKL